jgi:dTDP-4-dehydrorhamnose reductase
MNYFREDEFYKVLVGARNDVVMGMVDTIINGANLLAVYDAKTHREFCQQVKDECAAVIKELDMRIERRILTLVYPPTP